MLIALTTTGDGVAPILAAAPAAGRSLPLFQALFLNEALIRSSRPPPIYLRPTGEPAHRTCARLAAMSRAMYPPQCERVQYCAARNLRAIGFDFLTAVSTVPKLQHPLVTEIKSFCRERTVCAPRSAQV